MPLTDSERAYWDSVIKNTGAHREVMFQERKTPEEYAACLGQVERVAVIVQVPSVNVPVRCYVSTAKDKAPNCPIHVNMHGGGFMFPQDSDDDMYCAHLAVKTKGIVVDVDYSLSTEHPFPVAFEQSYEVVRWVFTQCAALGANPNRVSIGGHSAGGNLAAAISLKAAGSEDFKLCLQVLDYAALDFAIDPMDRPGKPEFMMSADRGRAFTAFYVDGDMNLARSPYVSPMFATDEMLAKQPRTLIISGGKCNFRFENERYGMRIAELGVEVSMKRFLSSRHGFTVRMTDEWQDAQALIIRAINEAWL